MAYLEVSPLEISFGNKSSDCLTCPRADCKRQERYHQHLKTQLVGTGGFLSTHDKDRGTTPIEIVFPWI